MTDFLSNVNFSKQVRYRPERITYSVPVVGEPTFIMVRADSLYLMLRQLRLNGIINTKATSFCHLHTPDQFDFNKVDCQLVYQLSTCQFVRDGLDLLLLSPPGIGKSNLAQAIDQQVICQGLLVLYRDIFDLVRRYFMKKETPGGVAQFLKIDLLPKEVI